MGKINPGAVIPAYPMPLSLSGAWFSMVEFKMKPLVLSQPATAYLRLGGPVAKAWSVGKKYKDKGGRQLIPENDQQK